MAGLRQHRGRDRDDYPVHVLWGVVLLRVLLRHVRFEAVLVVHLALRRCWRAARVIIIMLLAIPAVFGASWLLGKS